MRNQNRKLKIVARVSPKEFDLITHIAERLNLSVSELLRISPLISFSLVQNSIAWEKAKSKAQSHINEAGLWNS